MPYRCPTIKTKSLIACVTYSLLSCTVFNSYLFFSLINFEMMQRLAESLFVLCKILFDARAKYFRGAEKERLRYFK